MTQTQNPQVQMLINRLAETPMDAGINGVQITPMADGSGRWCALISFNDDSTQRLSSPAPENAPAWASIHSDWELSNV